LRGAKKRALLGGQTSTTTTPSIASNNPPPSEPMITINTNVSSISEISLRSHNNNASTIISRNDYGVITNSSNNNNSKNNNIFDAAATSAQSNVVESLTSYIASVTASSSNPNNSSTAITTTPATITTTNNNNQNNNTNTSNNYKKKFRSSSNETPPPPPPVSASASSSRCTPDNMSQTSNYAASSFGGMKFSYENQTTVTTHPSTVPPPSTQVKDSPPSSPGSEDANNPVGIKKRGRKLSCSTSNTSSSLSNVPMAVTIDIKDAKLFQNGVSGHVQHMLGNQINPASNVAIKLTDQLNMEIEAHSVYNSSSLDSGQSLIGPQFPGKNAGQSVSSIS
jgi:hypothetical protein